MVTTDKIVLEAPESVAQGSAIRTQDFLAEVLQRGLRETRIERALSHYQFGDMSFVAAVDAAGVSQSVLARYAYGSNIELPFNTELLTEEMSILTAPSAFFFGRYRPVFGCVHIWCACSMT